MTDTTNELRAALAGLKRDVLYIVHKFAAMTPEKDHDGPGQDEDWESWYVAAFDLMGSEIGDVLDAALATAKQPAPSPWVSVAQRIPEWTDDNSARVLVYTEGHDFGGEQVHDIAAADFYLDDPEEVDGPHGTEVTRAASHWMYRDDLTSLAGPVHGDQR